MNSHRLNSRLSSARWAAWLLLTLIALPALAADGPFALSFDGVDDFVIVTNSPPLNFFPQTITAWINTAQTNGRPGLLHKLPAGAVNGWQLHLVNGNLRARYLSAGGGYVSDSFSGDGLNGGFVADGAWHHVAFSVDASGGRLYVDGVVKENRTWSGVAGPPNNGASLRLGVDPDAASAGYYHGLLDEITIWNTSLPTSTIQYNMNRSLLGTETGLRIYYRVNEGSGTNLADSASGAGSNDGTLINGIAWAPGVLLLPGVQTFPQDELTAVSARLNAVASPGGPGTFGWFEWGTIDNYGIPTPPQPLGAGGADTNFSAVITNLFSEVAYYFRAVASNSVGLTTGGYMTFTPPRATNMLTERAEHTATLLPNGKVLVAGGYGIIIGVGGPTNTTELYDPATGTWAAASPMAVARGLHTATLLTNGLVLVAGSGQTAELYNPATGTWSFTGNMLATHNTHTATLLQNGKVLVAGGPVGNPELYDPATGTWTATGGLNVLRTEHTATLLPNGKVLLAGGQDPFNNHPLTSAELYDPATGLWTITGALKAPRQVHTATLLPNGKVLVAGGSDNTNYLASAELYDPATGAWTFTGQLATRRGYATASLLPNGKVLVAAGYPVFTPNSELYDPASGLWTASVAPSDVHWLHTATLLPGGSVLLAGGRSAVGQPTNVSEVLDFSGATWSNTAPMTSARYAHTATLLPTGKVLVSSYTNAELFNPATGTWSPAGVPITPRSAATANLLLSGKVLIAGGTDINLNGITTAELYDPATALWTNTGSLHTGRGGHRAVMLHHGKVLAAGGVSGFGSTFASAELYDPASGAWTVTGPMSVPRAGFTLTLLNDGRALAVGGVGGTFSPPYASAEVYDPATGVWTPVASLNTARSSHSAILLPGGKVLVVGGSMTSAELYDPLSGIWVTTAPMATLRNSPTLTLLANGQVLAAGGNSGSASAEIYNPATRTWRSAGTLNAARTSHSATFLPSGKVLVAGGFAGTSTITNSAELFDLNLGFSAAAQPVISASTSPVDLGASLGLTGSKFRGLSEGSYGTAKDSPADYPLCSLRALESGQTAFIPSASWSSNSFHSGPLSGVPAGFALATIYVNGIPSTAAVISVTSPFPVPPLLTGAIDQFDHSFQITFTNTLGASFGAWAASIVTLPFSNWTALGSATEISPGQYKFTDLQATNTPQRFYRLRSL